MIDCFRIYKLTGIALIGCVLTGSLLGCQPTTEETPSAVEGNSETNHAVDSDQEHADDLEDHDEHADNEHMDEGDDHSEHDHNTKSTTFECEPTATISAYYHTDSTPHTAHLLIDGVEYDLAAVSNSAVSTKMQTYTSNIGLDNTYGIVWQVNGDNATLLNKTLDSKIATQDETVLYQCAMSS